MKKIMIFMIMMGLVGISACASNEANMESAENDAEMAKDKSDAAKASAEAAEADAKAKTEAAEAEAAATAAKAKADAEEAEESVMAAGGSDNKASVCKNGENVRTITLVYNDESSENTCQVDYEKSSGVQTLWTAITDKDYCLEKAEEFVTKQEGWGWNCSALQ
jgi:hypothetical protein